MRHKAFFVALSAVFTLIVLGLRDASADYTVHIDTPPGGFQITKGTTTLAVSGNPGVAWDASDPWPSGVEFALEDLDNGQVRVTSGWYQKIYYSLQGQFNGNAQTPSMSSGDDLELSVWMIDGSGSRINITHWDNTKAGVAL